MPKLARQLAHLLASRQICLIQNRGSQAISTLQSSNKREITELAYTRLFRASTKTLASNSIITAASFNWWHRRSSSLRAQISAIELLIFPSFLENHFTQLPSSSFMKPPLSTSFEALFMLSVIHPADGFSHLNGHPWILSQTIGTREILWLAKR